MKDNPLLKLQSFGQSIWMDFIRRETIVSGELTRLIEEDGLRGVTSNPSIFEKAIAAATITTTPSAHWPAKGRLPTRSTTPSRWTIFSVWPICFVPFMIGWTERMGL